MGFVGSGRGGFVEYRVELGTSWLCVRSVGTLLSSLGRALLHFRYSRPPLFPSWPGRAERKGLAASKAGQLRPERTQGTSRPQRPGGAPMQALELALSELGDGVTLVWRRPERELVGQIKPVSAFRDDQGRVCRHVVYSLALGTYQRQIEGVACRESTAPGLFRGKWGS